MNLILIFSQVNNVAGPYSLKEPSANSFPMFSGSGSGQIMSLPDNSQNNFVSIGNGLNLEDADLANSDVYVVAAEVEIIDGTPVEQLFFYAQHPNISIVSYIYNYIYTYIILLLQPIHA